jgi:hypothetical protein
MHPAKAILRRDRLRAVCLALRRMNADEGDLRVVCPQVALDKVAALVCLAHHKAPFGPLLSP